MSSSSAAAITSKYPGLGGPKDTVDWEEYFTRVADDDTRLITRWQKLLDTLLVYVGLFIAVLTAFIVQVSSLSQPNPVYSTNQILIAIFNHKINDSSPIDFQQYVSVDGPSNGQIPRRLRLLYISFAISIVQGALALVIHVWLIRYQRSLSETGPAIHERIRKRHENYRGLMEWRLPILIEALPILALVALFLFAGFFSTFILATDQLSSTALDYIFIATGLFFVLTASFAAFIPGTPFHSFLSDCVSLTFGLISNRSIRGIIRIRTLCVILVCMASLAGIIAPPFLTDGSTDIFTLLFLFPIPVSLLSLCGTPAEKKAQQKPRLFTLATWLYSYSIVIFALFTTMIYLPPTPGIVFISLFCIPLLVMTKVAMQMSQRVDEANAKAGAISWMINTHPYHNSANFKNAIEISRNSSHLRSALLEDILPILDALITSIQGNKEQDLGDEEKNYITLLAVVVDFEPCKRTLWRNEAAVKRPVLSDRLKEKLRELSKGGCSGHSSPTAGCTKDEAGFVLGKVGEADGVEKESALVEPHVV